MLCIPNWILLSQKKSFFLQENVWNWGSSYYANKPDTEKQVSYFFSYMEILKNDDDSLKVEEGPIRNGKSTGGQERIKKAIGD